MIRYKISIRDLPQSRVLYTQTRYNKKNLEEIYELTKASRTLCNVRMVEISVSRNSPIAKLTQTTSQKYNTYIRKTNARLQEEEEKGSSIITPTKKKKNGRNIVSCNCRCKDECIFGDYCMIRNVVYKCKMKVNAQKCVRWYRRHHKKLSEKSSFIVF